MKFQKNIIYILIINIYFIGCNSGENILKNIEGKAIANGYLQKSTVCLDIDNNNICSKNEPKTITNNSGFFKLNLENIKLDEVKKSPILVYGGIDKRTKEKFNGKFKTFVKNKNVTLTPLNTVIYFMTKSVKNKDNEYLIYDINTLIKNIFIVNNINLSEDPLKFKNIDNNLFKITQIIHKVIENLTINLSDSSRDDYILSIYKKVSRLILDDKKIDFRDVIKDIINSDKNISLKKEKETNHILNKIEELNYKDDKLIGLKIDSMIRGFKNKSLFRDINLNSSLTELRSETILSVTQPYIKKNHTSFIKKTIIKILTDAQRHSDYISAKEEIKLFLSKKETKEIGETLKRIMNNINPNILNSKKDINFSKLYLIDDNLFLNHSISRISIKDDNKLKIDKVFIDNDFNINILKDPNSKFFLIYEKWKNSNNLLKFEFNKNLLYTQLFTLNIKNIFNLKNNKNNKKLSTHFKDIIFNSESKAYLIEENINSLYSIESNYILGLDSLNINSLLSFLEKSYITIHNNEKIYLNRYFKNGISLNNSPIIDIDRKVIIKLEEGLEGELISIKDISSHKFDNVKVIGYWKIVKLINSNILAIYLSINNNLYILHKNRVHQVKKIKGNNNKKLFVNEEAFKIIKNSVKKNL